MDKPSNEQLDLLALKKQLAVYLVGSAQQYQNYKRTQQLHSFFPSDLHYYNDTFYYRHDRNIEEISKLKELIKNKVLKPEMLLFNSWNSFYPSYILHHHMFIFTPILNLFNQVSQMKEIISLTKTLDKLGGYFQNTLNINFTKTIQNKNQKPRLNENGEIVMNKQVYFYDKHVSLYFNIACFIATTNKLDSVIVFVRLRDQNGEICKNIAVKDLGQRISLDYLQIGYNFNQVKPFLAIKINNNIQNKINQLNGMSYFYEFNLSMLDLKKSLYLAIQYTSMRQQFTTLSQSKQQRPIVSYQAVGTRIINAFAKFVCFSEVNRSLLNNSTMISFASILLDVNHHLILESIMRLRECCGGFGYLQVAGHGAGIERVSLRASEAVIVNVPENPQILKRLHYYSSSDDMQSYFGDMLTKQTAFNPTQIFAVFINICVNMRRSSSQLKKQVYLRHFMHQAAIQILKTTQQFTRLPRDTVIFQTLFYQVANYIIDNSQFINWKFIQKHLTRQDYFHGLLQFKNTYLNKLLKKISLIGEILQVSHLRNVIIGRENKQEFYEQVLKSAKSNLRNSQEFVDYVKRPIVDFLISNNESRL